MKAGQDNHETPNEFPPLTPAQTPDPQTGLSPQDVTLLEKRSQVLQPDQQEAFRNDLIGQNQYIAASAAEIRRGFAASHESVTLTPARARASSRRLSFSPL
jgi:hypothetical protein